MQLNKADVERIAEELIRKLSLEVESPDWTDPNNRTIVLKLGDRKITDVSFNVVQKREYEG